MEDPQSLIPSIAKFSLFQELEKYPDGLLDLARLMKRETFQVRDFIIDERQLDTRMFFLLQGQVVINKMNENGQIVVIGRTDDRSHPYFGESILLGNFKKSANVIAHSQCECLSLQAKDFAAFMDSHPSVVASIYRNMAKVLFDRLVKANKDIFIAGLSSKL